MLARARARGPRASPRRRPRRLSASWVALPPGAAHRSRIRSPGCAPTASAGELRPAALRPDEPVARATRCGIRSTRQGSRESRRRARRGTSRPRAVTPDGRLGGSFCAAMSASARRGRARARRSRRPSPGTSAGARPRSVSSRRASRAARRPLGEPAHDRVRERHGALEPGRAHQLDRLVRRGMRRHRVDEAELVGAETQRGAHGRIELAHGPAAERRRSRGRACARAAPCRTRAACANARSRWSSPAESAAARNARSAYAPSSNTRPHDLEGDVARALIRAVPGSSPAGPPLTPRFHPIGEMRACLSRIVPDSATRSAPASSQAAAELVERHRRFAFGLHLEELEAAVA